MKLLTLNTHSLVEENYSEKLEAFVLTIAKEKPDIIALQEVNQTILSEKVSEPLIAYVPCSDGVVIRNDNHIYKIVNMLRSLGIEYDWTWLPLKKGYDKYDEGIALMSRSKILETEVIPISKVDDYNNWKTRKIIGIRTESAAEDWFFSVHYGWWDDKEEAFQEQWKRTLSSVKKYQKVWLLGDFNSPAQIRNEGYDMIKKDGWYDTYVLAKEKDSGNTVENVIDGWKDKLHSATGMRIDQIWCSKEVKIASSKVIFNGKNQKIVSDHYGIVVNY